MSDQPADVIRWSATIVTEYREVVSAEAYDKLAAQLAELAAKERREFAWAEEYMQKSRELEAQLAATHAAIRALRDKVKDLEWGGEFEHVHGCCAFCLRFPVEGHEADCGMAALARLLGDPAQEQP